MPVIKKVKSLCQIECVFCQDRGFGGGRGLSVRLLEARCQNQQRPDLIAGFAREEMLNLLLLRCNEVACYGEKARCDPVAIAPGTDTCTSAGFQLSEDRICAYRGVLTVG